MGLGERLGGRAGGLAEFVFGEIRAVRVKNSSQFYYLILVAVHIGRRGLDEVRIHCHSCGHD